MWKYALTDEGRRWMNLPKDSLGSEYSKFRNYIETVLNFLSQANRPLSAEDISKNTGIKKERVDHILKLYYYVGYLDRVRTLM